MTGRAPSVAALLARRGPRPAARWPNRLSTVGAPSSDGPAARAS